MVNISFLKPEHKIGKTIKADLFLRTNANYTRTVAKHPIEDGSTISDHIVKEPIRVTIVGLISGSPIEYDILYTTPDHKERVNAVYEELLSIWEDVSKTTIIELVDGDKEYKSMVLVGLSILTDENTGDSFQFEADFEEIRLVKKRYVDADFLSPNPSMASAGVKKDSTPKKSLGNQPTSKVSGKGTTALKQIVNKIAKWAL